MTKEKLYNRVNAIREHWGIKPEHYPLDSINICNKVRSLQVEYLPFKTPGLQGVLMLQQDCDSLIILNSRRNRLEQNFFCAHELGHFLLHRNVPTQSFHCFGKIRHKQNAFQEWQANEWAAEFLVPYRLFIPELFRKLKLTPSPDIDFYPPIRNIDCLPSVRQYLSRMFGVSERVVYNRIESLKYEIKQYQLGVSISDIIVRSINQQLKIGLRIKSINEPAKPFVFNKSVASIY